MKLSLPHLAVVAVALVPAPVLAASGYQFLKSTKSYGPMWGLAKDGIGQKAYDGFCQDAFSAGSRAADTSDFGPNNPNPNTGGYMMMNHGNSYGPKGCGNYHKYHGGIEERTETAFGEKTFHRKCNPFSMHILCKVPNTDAPTDAPSETPSAGPTASPVTEAPTHTPTPLPTASPVTAAPTSAPTASPVTAAPTSAPTASPVTAAPTSAPTASPVTEAPSTTPRSAPAANGRVGGAAGAPAALGSSSGDPHFKTFSGDKFDFHGGCDLVLLQNNGFAHDLGMNIHIRTKISTWWSSIESAAVQIGPDTLEVTGGENGGMRWINGQPFEDIEDGASFALSGFHVQFHQVSPRQKKYRIDLGNGDAMSIETFKDFVRVNVRAQNKEQFHGSLGLMGEYPSGLKVGRDGSTVVKDPNHFGPEWQVLDSEPMLFHSVEGPQHPLECAMPSKTAFKKKRRLGESLISEEEASAACARVDEDDRDACIFDVLATNDKDMAGSY